MSDLGNPVEWAGMVVAVKHTSTALPGPGWQFRCTFRFLGQWMEQTFEVIEWQTHGHITVKSTSGTIPCVFLYRFDAAAEGTLMCPEAVLYPVLTGEKVGLSEAVVAQMMRRQIAKCTTLKALLENQPCDQAQNCTCCSTLAHKHDENF